MDTAVVIGALIPAFNAEATIAGAVAGARRQLPVVLVVDDGSRDETSARAFTAGAHVTRHEINRGKGAALKTGFAWLLARGAGAVVTLDADMQHDPEDIPRFLQAYASGLADLIVGSRRMSFEAMTRGRRIGNRFSCRALRFFTGLDLPDSQSGFRLYGGEYLRDLRLRRDGYDAEMEALLQAARGRYRVEFIPVRTPAVDGRPTSSFRPWRDTYRICRTVVLFSVLNP